MKKKKVINYYASFHEVSKELNQKQFYEFNSAIFSVMFYECHIDDISFDDKLLAIAWTSVKHSLQASIDGFCNKQKIEYEDVLNELLAKGVHKGVHKEVHKEVANNVNENVKVKVKGKEKGKGNKAKKTLKESTDLTSFQEKGYDLKVINLLIEHRKGLKKPLDTDRKIQGLLNAIQIYADHWKIKPAEAVDFYLQQSWISIDPEYKYTGRQLKPNNPTSDLSYKDIGIMIQQEKNRRAGTGVGKINSVIQSITKQVEV